MVSKFIKIGSIYKFNIIHGITNILSINKKVMIKYAIFRVIKVLPSSTITININNVTNNYTLEDVNTIFNSNNKFPDTPFMIYYNYDESDINSCQYIFGVYTDEYVDNINITINPDTTASDAAFSYEVGYLYYENKIPIMIEKEENNLNKNVNKIKNEFTNTVNEYIYNYKKRKVI